MNDNMQEDQPEVSIHQEGISSQQENNEIKGETIQTTKRKTGKLTKREIRELSTTNHNINKWLSKATIKKAENEDMDEVVEAMETEEIPDIGRASRIGKAKAMETHWMNIRMIESVVVDIVMETEARVEAKDIIEKVIEISVWKGSINKIWKELIGDNDIKVEIVRRLEVEEKEILKQARLEKVKEKILLLQRKEVEEQESGDDEVVKECNNLESMMELEYERLESMGEGREHWPYGD